MLEVRARVSRRFSGRGGHVRVRYARNRVIGRTRAEGPQLTAGPAVARGTDASA